MSNLRDVERAGTAARDLQEALSSGEADPLADPSVPAPMFMRALFNQVGLAEVNLGDSGAAAENDPFGDYLQAVTRRIETGATALYEDLVAAGTPASAAEIVCCLLGGIHEIAARHGGGDEADELRRIAEDELTDWLLFFRSALVMIQDLGWQGAATFHLNILTQDVGAIIREALEDALVAPLMSLILLFEKMVQDLNRSVMSEISRVGCAPLIRLWGAVLSFLYDTPGGFLYRVRAHVQESVVRSQRRIDAALELPAQGGNRRRSFVIADLIALIDALLDAANLFRTCRIAPRPDRRRQSEDGPRRRGPRRGPDEDDSDGPGRDRPAQERRLTVTEDPDLGELAILETGADDTLYLTPTNAALFATRVLGADPAAARAAAEGDCEAALSDATRGVLEDIGIFN